uniref:Permease n=1 Tax=Solibacter usitatus (strain Ellin6076) TaxID=234267 RepID=Q021E6_SOLUE
MSLVQDVRFACRIIRKNPWFSAAIVATLAFGMGVNTTVFSLVNAVLYKPLPFRGGERLVMAYAVNRSNGENTMPVSYADYRNFRDESHSFERLELFDSLAVNLGERGNPPERFRGGRISAGMFDMLATHPVLGRGMSPADEKAGAPQVVLLGYGVWRDRYGKDPGVLGRAVRVNEKPAVIIGVMPEGFKFPNNEDLWLAAIPDAAAEKRSNRDYRMIGMLKPGIPITEARADLGAIAKRLAQAYPETNKDHGATVLTFHDAMNGGPIRLVFLLMMGAVGFVLLIACANVANMLLSRAVERTREVSIRTAMGAGRWRLVGQMLIESVLLASLGGLLGLVLARAGISAFGRAVADVGKPYWIDFSMDYVVFAYFGALTILTGLLFGLAPALAATRVNLNDALKDGSRGSSGGSGYLSGALVILQFTLSVVLLSGAGLMMRSFLLAQSEFGGMNADKVLVARVRLPQDRYPKDADRQRFFDKLMPRVAALPGVSASAMVSDLPGDGSATRRFEIAGRPITEARRLPAASVVMANTGYLQLLGLTLLRGRDFEATDGLPGKETVIVSQTMAARFFPNQDPVGRQLRVYKDDDKPQAWMTIIGVAPDFRQKNPSDPADDPVLLVPYRFDSYSSMALMLRTNGNPAALAPALRNEVQQIDTDLPLFDMMTLAERFGKQRWYLSVFGTVFLIFAIIATAMAAVGIYAVMAQAANGRTREIGVRMALGADEGSILALVLSRGVKQLGTGMVLGLAAALAVCRLMAKLLFMVSPNDLVTFVAVTLVLGTAGMAAIFFPARRAARLDPLKALRYE